MHRCVDEDEEQLFLCKRHSEVNADVKPKSFLVESDMFVI